MSKRRAIALFGSIMVLLLGYIAWSCRDFYRKPRLGMPESFDSTTQEAIRDWYKSAPAFRHEAITKEGLLRALSNPWKEFGHRSWVIGFGPDEVGIEGPQSEFYLLKRLDGEWRVVVGVPAR